MLPSTNYFPSTGFQVHNIEVADQGCEANTDYTHLPDITLNELRVSTVSDPEYMALMTAATVGSLPPPVFEEISKFTSTGTLTKNCRWTMGSSYSVTTSLFQHRSTETCNSNFMRSIKESSRWRDGRDGTVFFPGITNDIALALKATSHASSGFHIKKWAPIAWSPAKAGRRLIGGYLPGCIFTRPCLRLVGTTSFLVGITHAIIECFLFRGSGKDALKQWSTIQCPQLSSQTT